MCFAKQVLASANAVAVDVDPLTYKKLAQSFVDLVVLDNFVASGVRLQLFEKLLGEHGLHSVFGLINSADNERQGFQLLFARLVILHYPLHFVFDFLKILIFVYLSLFKAHQ